MNHILPDVQARFRKGRGMRDQIANIRWIIEKAREFQKNIYFASMTMLKPLTAWITTNCGKFLNRWEYQTTLPWMEVGKLKRKLGSRSVQLIYSHSQKNVNSLSKYIPFHGGGKHTKDPSLVTIFC